MNYEELLKEARDLLVLCTMIDKSDHCQNMVNKIDNALNQGQSLPVDSVSISLPDYEYEMLIDDEGTPFEINSWIPIATDRIKDLSRIDEYITKGLIRKKQ